MVDRSGPDARPTQPSSFHADLDAITRWAAVVRATRDVPSVPHQVRAPR